MAYLFQKKYQRAGKTRKMKKWTIRYYDRDGRRREAAGYRDRRATEALALQLETNAERGEIGIHDPYQEHRLTPLSEHVAAFRVHLERKIPEPRYVDLKITRVEKMTATCKRLVDITEDRILDSLRSLTCGAQTRNHYLQAVKQFCLWAVRKKRIRDNPLVGLQPENVKIDPGLKVRRALTSAEVGKVLQTTMKSKRQAMGLAGRDRAMLYLVAATTGLRASELGSLRACDFLLEDSPAIRLKAASDKSRRGVEQPLPEAIVPELAGYLARKQPAELVWPGWWKHKAWKMVRRDLKDAGIPVKTEEGVFDFHAWRHTYISLLAMTGLQPKVVQDLARHSDIRLTMSRYAHTQKIERHQAANQFPLQFPLRAGGMAGGTGIPENRKVIKGPKNRVLPTGIEPVTYGLGIKGCTCGKAVITGLRALARGVPPAIPPELRAVLIAWPRLSSQVKKAILALAA